MPKFTTTVVRDDDTNGTGIEVPAKIVEMLGNGKKPKVTVTINDYTYRSTVFVYGGKFYLPLAAEHRKILSVDAGDDVTVTLERDAAPREVAVPQDLAAALKTAGATKHFGSLAYTHRKEHVRAIEEAKAPETRARRIAKAVDMVLSKRP